MNPNSHKRLVCDLTDEEACRAFCHLTGTRWAISSLSIRRYRRLNGGYLAVKFPIRLQAISEGGLALFGTGETGECKITNQREAFALLGEDKRGHFEMHVQQLDDYLDSINIK